jgi:methyl-accepting chemotaxis protein
MEMSSSKQFFRRTWVVIPRYQTQLATTLAILQITTCLIFLGIMQFRVRALATDAGSLDRFLSLNLYRELIPWTLGVSFGVAIAAWFMGLYFSNSIVGPIPRMRRFLAAVGQGDFSQRVQVRPGDAMEHLSHDLNGLAIDLEKRYGSRRADGPARTAGVDQRSNEPVQSAT